MQHFDPHFHAARGDVPKISREQLPYFMKILAGNQSHRDLRIRRRRNHRFGPFAGIAPPDAVHVERRPDPGAFQRRISFFALRFENTERLAIGRLAKRRGGKLPMLLRSKLTDAVVKAGNRNAPFGIDQRSDHPGEHIDRIGYRSAVQTGMQVAVRPRHFDLNVTQTAQAAGDRRHLPRQQAGIRNQNDVGSQQLPVQAAPSGDAARTDLLFAFDHKFHIARERAGLQHGFQRLDMHIKLSLVVVGAARPDPAVADDRFERIGLPPVGRIDRHHVVMAVDQHGLSRRIDDFLGVNDRISFSGHHFGAVGSGTHQQSGQQFGTTHHVGRMHALRTDGRNPQQFEQLPDETLLVFVDIRFRFIHKSAFKRSG